jgi:hypothetical protein
MKPKRQATLGHQEKLSKQAMRPRLKWSKKALTTFRAEVIGHVLSLLLLIDLIE